MVARTIPSQGPANARVKGDALTAARLSWLEACSLDTKISAMELRLAVQLALQYAGLPKSRARFEENSVPVAWPPQILLAEVLGCSRQGVSAAGRRLAKRGHIEIKPGLGRGHATEYLLCGKGKKPGGLLRKPIRQQQDHEKAMGHIAKGKDTTPGKASKLAAPFHSSRPIHHTHSQSRGERDGIFSGEREVKHPEFEKIFKMWPNAQKDHGMALGAWINNVVKPGVDPGKVLRRAEAWFHYWEDEQTKLIPYLGKWLAECGWQHKAPPSAMDELKWIQSKYSVEEDENEDEDDDDQDKDMDCIHDPDSLD